MFGVALGELIARENNDATNDERVVPHVLELCLSEIERRGLTEAGLCKWSNFDVTPITSLTTSLQIE